MNLLWRSIPLSFTQNHMSRRFSGFCVDVVNGPRSVWRRFECAPVGRQHLDVGAVPLNGKLSSLATQRPRDAVVTAPRDPTRPSEGHAPF